MKKTSITVGFLGFGTVGSGAVRILQEHKNEISARLNVDLKIKAICSPSIINRDSSWVEADVIRTTEAKDVIFDPEIDIIVEAIGGREPANSYICQAFEQGKSVVTANKLLLASNGVELAKLAVSKQLSLGIEAAVAGGIPILNAIRGGLVGERIVSVHGILNGTTNFILTEMEKSGAAFESILAEAQRLGYAEADPTLDIEGFDARDKLAILVMLCFGRYVDVEKIPTKGITQLTPADFVYAAQTRSTIKLLCTAKLVGQDILLSVEPTLIPRSSILAKVNGSFNAVMITGSAAGQTFYYGRGAGSGPTGVAVVSDIVRIARELVAGTSSLSPTFSFHSLEKQDSTAYPSQPTSYSVRFTVVDRPGIIARLAGVFSDHNINIDSISQEKLYKEPNSLSFMIMLEPTTQEQLNKALDSIKTLDFLVQPPMALRMEENL